jgi:hypothetical protein
MKELPKIQPLLLMQERKKTKIALLSFHLLQKQMVEIK